MQEGERVGMSGIESTEERIVNKENVIDFNGEVFPKVNRCVVMAGLSECQKDRVFELLVPIEGIRIDLPIENWYITTNRNTGNRMMEFSGGKTVDLGYYERKHGSYDLPEANSGIRAAVFQDIRSAFAGCLREASEGNNDEELVNSVISIPGDSISQIITVSELLYKKFRGNYKMTLIYVDPDLRVQKYEYRKKLMLDDYSSLKQQIVDLNSTLFELQNRRDLQEAFEEIWVVIPKTIVDNDDEYYIENTDIYRVKKAGETSMRLDMVGEILDKQIFLCQHDEFFSREHDFVSVCGGRNLR